MIMIIDYDAEAIPTLFTLNIFSRFHVFTLSRFHAFTFSCFHAFHAFHTSHAFHVLFFFAPFHNGPLFYRPAILPLFPSDCETSFHCIVVFTRSRFHAFHTFALLTVSRSSLFHILLFLCSFHICSRPAILTFFTLNTFSRFHVSTLFTISRFSCSPVFFFAFVHNGFFALEHHFCPYSR